MASTVIHLLDNTFRRVLFFLLPGIVGDILLNNMPLRDFTIYSLDMTRNFIDRFVKILFEIPAGTIKLDRASALSQASQTVAFKFVQGSVEIPPSEAKLSGVSSGKTVRRRISERHVR